jgi:sensor histidine kinase regulating citrate/malate metabolism
MKKYLILMLSVAFICILSVSAQEKAKNTTSVIEKRVEKMAMELSLTDAEKAKVKTLLEKQSNDYDKLKSGLTPGSEDFKVKLKELRKTQNEELKKVLGNEKYAKYNENRVQEKQKVEAAKAKM